MTSQRFKNPIIHTGSPSDVAEDVNHVVASTRLSFSRHILCVH